jgi:16S rRNA processing protein RimM
VKLAAIAHIRRTRGVRGEVVATPLSDFRDRFASLDRVFVGGREFRVETVWWHDDDLVLRFRGISSIDEAKALAGLDVEIPAAERVPLPPGQYYPDELIGFEVWSGAERVGVVEGWQDLGRQTLLEAGGVEIPYGLVRRVDVAERRIAVELPEGLKELNRS